jgi:hypothetical protein
MMFWSAPYWFVFEAFNLRLRNWYYVFAFHSDVLQGGMSFLAFATVFPACFMHVELMGALGLFEHRRWRPLRVGRAMILFCCLGGALCIVMPLAVPRYAFPLVWGATLGIPAVINYRSGAPSLLRDLEAGRPQRLLRLLSGGLVAGLVWEGLNYWARCKWIYTVPGLEEWKLFEMPVLGFFGFPVLSLEAFCFYSMLCHFLRGGRHWGGSDTGAGAVERRALHGLAGVGALLLSIGILVTMLNTTVRSRRPLIANLRGVDRQLQERFADLGIDSPETLVHAIDCEGLYELAQRARLSPDPLRRAYRHAGLAIHKGMGTRMAGYLLDAGVGNVEALARRDADALWREVLQMTSDAGEEPPRLAEVRVWVRAAGMTGRPRR